MTCSTNYSAKSYQCLLSNFTPSSLHMLKCSWATHYHVSLCIIFATVEHIGVISSFVSSNSSDSLNLLSFLIFNFYNIYYYCCYHNHRHCYHHHLFLSIILDFWLSWCMNRALCIICYLDQPLRNILTVMSISWSTPTCFDVFTSSSGSLFW